MGDTGGPSLGSVDGGQFVETSGLSGCENPTCDVHGNTDVPHAVPSAELDRLITAIDQQYTVEDLGYAGDARIVNVRDKRTGEYILTATLTQTP